MVQKPNKGKAVLATGAAMAFCAASLYAADKVLRLLFRDVDPDRIENKEFENEELKNREIENEEKEGNEEDA